jgi:3-methyladenine DNA glycosylase Tag
MPKRKRVRCWGDGDELMAAYHDLEWGVPLHDDDKIFEFLFLEVQKEFGTLNHYIWGFVDGKPVRNRLRSFREMATRTPLSNQVSQDLKARGFKFVGSTVIYAHMQATGLVNDHLVSCFRYPEINRIFSS